MKYYTVLLTFGLALSNPIEDDPSNTIRKYPQIVTDIPFIDASAMDFDELLNKATSHPGLEWLKDEELLAQSGIDVTNIHPDIIADAFSTTVRMIFGVSELGREIVTSCFVSFSAN